MDTHISHVIYNKVAIDPHRAEGWIAFALWQESCGDREEALGSVEKALKLNPNCFLGHRVRGELLLALDTPQDAIVSFFKAKVHTHAAYCTPTPLLLKLLPYSLSLFSTIGAES